MGMERRDWNGVRTRKIRDEPTKTNGMKVEGERK